MAPSPWAALKTSREVELFAVTHDGRTPFYTVLPEVLGEGGDIARWIFFDHSQFYQLGSSGVLLNVVLEEGVEPS